ncbi:hypothetical protein FJZ31_41090 [Candidatus Poribacteria bacterium]|nr:hypothetical protein [Candidatus Poribacteria bacterium]
MLNIKKAITVSSILFNNFISLSLFLALFCLSGHLYAQMPPALDFPPGIELDPRHPRVLGEKGLAPSAISENVEFVGFCDTPGYALDVYVSGGYAYVADGINGLRVIDVSFPENPREVGFYDTPGSAAGVYVSGSYAYVVDGYSGFRVIDVSSSSNPFEVGFYDTPGWAWDVYVSGSYAYVADWDKGLRVIDISIPQNPVEVGF